MARSSPPLSPFFRIGSPERQQQGDMKGGCSVGTSEAIRRPGRRGDLFDPACPTRQLLDRVGTKWTAMVVKLLADAGGDAGRDVGVDTGADTGAGELRFAELERRMPGVSHKMLSQTLRTLGDDGLVRRRVEGTVPPRVFYSLTPLGRSLSTPLALLREWAEEHMAEVDDARAARGR
jgi:DNA-binding HxlR family transcriptional regulator